MSDKCPICNRDLGSIRIEKHHLVPKSLGGKDTYAIHKMCHRKIHSLFSERELKNYYHTFARICEHEDMQKFIKWISKKDPSFYDNSDVSNRRK